MHDCPRCGQACYCSGDIDDIPMPEPPHCRHCPEEDEPDYDAPKPLTPLENWQQNDEHHV